jgi:hypothetical protein
MFVNFEPERLSDAVGKHRCTFGMPAVMASLPTFLIAFMLWLVSRIASMRELMATTLNECRALADKMVATSDKAKLALPSAVQAVLKMKPAEENRVTNRS